MAYTRNISSGQKSSLYNISLKSKSPPISKVSYALFSVFWLSSSKDDRCSDLQIIYSLLIVVRSTGRQATDTTATAKGNITTQISGLVIGHRNSTIRIYKNLWNWRRNYEWSSDLESIIISLLKLICHFLRLLSTKD